MSVSYLVMYRGDAHDPEGFVERYRSRHVPILKSWPAIRGVTLHTPIAWHDPQTVKPSGIALLAQMQFDSLGELSAALTSEARAAARRDFREFPAFEGEVLHQAMLTEHL